MYPGPAKLTQNKAEVGGFALLAGGLYPRGSDLRTPQKGPNPGFCSRYGQKPPENTGICIQVEQKVTKTPPQGKKPPFYSPRGRKTRPEDLEPRRFKGGLASFCQKCQKWLKWLFSVRFEVC